MYTDVYIQRIAELENKLNEKERHAVPLTVNEQFSGEILDLENFKQSISSQKTQESKSCATVETGNPQSNVADFQNFLIQNIDTAGLIERGISDLIYALSNTTLNAISKAQILQELQYLQVKFEVSLPSCEPGRVKNCFAAYEYSVNNIPNYEHYFTPNTNFYSQDVAVAAEPTFNRSLDSLPMRTGSLSPSKSIWSFQNNISASAPIGVPSQQTDALSIYPFGTGSILNPPHAALWQTEYHSVNNEQKISAQKLAYNANLGGTEEYDQNYANEIEYPNFDENIKSHFLSLVDKIVRTNDQPASLLLQQRIKTSTDSIKKVIFECITENCIALIRNRFGNFLMQRCIECGTPAQVCSIAQIMKGNIYSLSCDRFGCHVVQKAIELMNMECRIAFISEILPYVHETIVHRFACHVWQRIFEIKWVEEKDSVQLMSYINNTMKGYWQRIANDENGSLVVQCIFEHCSNQDKIPLLSEVMVVIFDISKGQWGNWVVQHILEHGSMADRQYVFDTVSKNIFQMSVDQYASKVVEKALKTAPKRELSDMINSVITKSSDAVRPFILDMMSNQYANYVVQHILNIAEQSQRDMCIQLINPHINALKGSKYGQRVSLLVERMSRLSIGGNNGQWISPSHSTLNHSGPQTNSYSHSH